MNTGRHLLRVMLVDDHRMVMAGYARLLALEPDLDVVAQHDSADAAYQDLLDAGSTPDVVVLDLSMPGRSGLDLARRAALRWPGLRLLACTMHDSAAMVAQAVRAGVHGVITKRSDPALLPAAIRRVAAGERVLSPDIDAAPAAAAARPPHELLSVREFDVFVRLARGDTLERIAEALHIAPKTAANLQTQVRTKLQISGAVELLRYARHHRLIFD